MRRSWSRLSAGCDLRAPQRRQLGPLSRETRTLPIVFVGASDPVGAGYVASLPHPGGNITGFTLFEPTLAGKWLGALKEVTPGLARVETPDQSRYGALSFAGRSIRRRSKAPRPNSASSRFTRRCSISRTSISADRGARKARPNGSALIVAPDTFSDRKVNGDLIVRSLANERYRGSRGDLSRSAASRKARRADQLRHQTSTMRSSVRRPMSTGFSEVRKARRICRCKRRSSSISSSTWKTAKALGLTIAESFLLRADEVIE